MLKDNTVQLVYDRFIYPSYLLQHGKGGKKYKKKTLGNKEAVNQV